MKKNWLKEVVASLAAVLILAHVTGCGKKAEVVVDASSEELIASEEFGIKDEYTGGIVFGEGYSSWQEGYRAYIDEFLKSDSSDYSYALIYVDDDDIPELVCESGYEAGGCTILSYYDGKVTLLQTSRLYFNYIEESGLLCMMPSNLFMRASSSTSTSLIVTRRQRLASISEGFTGTGWIEGSGAPMATTAVAAAGVTSRPVALERVAFFNTTIRVCPNS